MRVSHATWHRYAAELDVAGSMHASVGRDLDDFLADGDDGVAEQRAYYTVYGLRKQADESRAEINNEEPEEPKSAAGATGAGGWFRELRWRRPPRWGCARLNPVDPLA